MIARRSVSVPYAIGRITNRGINEVSERMEERKARDLRIKRRPSKGNLF